jgi:hypothetical protein
MEPITPTKRRGPRKKSPEYFIDKYADICAAYLAGFSLTVIAKRNNTSRQRIHQIVTAAGIQRQVTQPKGAKNE